MSDPHPPQPARSPKETVPASLHDGCFVCGRDNPFGLRAVYVHEEDGRTVAQVRCPSAWAGYPGSVHGGITASLLDGAMVHCLFARGVIAVTARMAIQFHGPVVLAETLTVAAQIVTGRHGLYELEAELSQLDRIRATATGTFVRMHGCDLDPSRWQPARNRD